MPISTPPLANNKIEQRINDAFYPAHAKAQAQTAAGQPSTPSDEPPDMFELANSRPETFGNLHYNDLPAPQLAPAAPLQPLEQLEPIVPPDPVEPAALTPTESSPSAPHKPVPESNELKIEHD
ncbi:MAG: hypothetical protein ABIS48_00595 [Candidatus Saccharimonadales bacterium]